MKKYVVKITYEVKAESEAAALMQVMTTPLVGMIYTRVGEVEHGPEGWSETVIKQVAGKK